MKNQKKILKEIIQEFPELTFEITKEYHSNEIIREICSNYVECLHTIRSIENKKTHKRKYKKHLVDLLGELEKELKMMIKKEHINAKKSIQ